MFIVEALFSKAALALRGTRADKIGAETAPKHAPWNAGLSDHRPLSRKRHCNREGGKRLVWW